MVIASGAIDDRRPFGPLSESSSSFFSEDLVPTKRQVGFWKSESTIDHKGSKSVIASPLEKIHPMVVNPAGDLEHPGGQAFTGQLDMLNHSNLVGREDNTSNLHSVSWGDVLSSSRSRLGMSAAFLEPTGANQHMHDYGVGPSTCKLRLIANGAPGQSVGEESSGCSANEPLGSMREVEAKTIGDLLPDDLISRIMDGFEHTGFPNHDDVDEDIFCTGGGMELEDDSKNGDRYQDAATHQLKNSSPGTIGKAGYKSLDNSTFHDLYSPARLQFNKSLHDFSMSDPQKLSSPIRIESTHQRNNQAALGEPRGSLGHTKIGQGLQAFHPHSLPEYQDGICNISKSMPVSARNGSFRLIESGHHNNYNTNPSGLHGHSSDQNEALGFTGVGSCPLHGQDYTWNNSTGFLQSPSAPVLWSNFQHPVHMHGYSAVPPHMLNTCTHPMDHHLGSTPNNFGSFANMHTFHPRSLENVRISGSPQQYPSDFCVFGPTIGNYGETMFSPVSAGFPSLHQLFHPTNGRNPMPRVSTSYDATNDRIRSRRHDGNVIQSENKKQFELDVDRIAKGEDLRTTLMIKNIPNKYNCKLLLAAIDENHRGTYDFIYLPIDFKNKCNVGYAFINMTDPQHIIPFYKTFNGKKWDKFNSEKVASLAYARIQGRDALISHFQNSSLMNEDKWCRPILFHKDGPNAGDQEPFPVGNNVRSRSGRNRSSASSDTRDGTPSTSLN